jgi:hypothetical protein
VYYFYLDLYIYFGFPLARLKWRILLKSVRLPLQERREFLRVTKAPVTDSTYATIIISSMPNTYRPTIQTVETTMKVTGKTLDPNDLIAIFIEEAEHRVIGEAQAKHAEAAMIAD